MNKKFISVLLFGAMLFASTSMFVSCSYEEDIATLRTDVTDLTSLVNSKMQAVEAEIDALGSQTETLEAAYEAAMEAIANADAEAKEAAQANAAQIAAAMELINSAVADLQAAFDADVADLVAKDAELTSAITAAQAKAEQASGLVAELKTVVEALQKTVENLEKQMTILGDKVKAIADSLGFASDMKAYKADPTAYKGNVADISSFLRLAVTGKLNAPDLYTVMQLLGKERVLERLRAYRS